MTNSDPTNRHTFDNSSPSSDTSGSRRSKALPIALVGLLAAGAVGAGVWVSQRDTNDVAAAGDSVPELPPATTVETVPPPTMTTIPATEALELRVRSGGGFTMWGNDLRSASQISIFRKQLFVPGAMTEQFPQDALVPVLTRTLTNDEVAEIAKAATEAGLENDVVDYGDPGVTDMPTTDITYTANGKTHRHSIYGLGFDTPPGTLTGQQTQSRERISTFLRNLALDGRTTTPYFGERMVWTASKMGPETTAWQDIVPGQLAWPLPAYLKGDVVGCIVSDGDDAKKILDAFKVAKQNTIWTTPDGSLWQAAARVVLPGEVPCEVPEATPLPITEPPLEAPTGSGIPVVDSTVRDSTVPDVTVAEPGVSPAAPPQT